MNKKWKQLDIVDVINELEEEDSKMNKTETVWPDEQEQEEKRQDNIGQNGNDGGPYMVAYDPIFACEMTAIHDEQFTIEDLYRVFVKRLQQEQKIVGYKLVDKD